MIPHNFRIGVGFTVALALLGVLLYLVGSINPGYSSSGSGEPILTGDDVVEHDHSDDVTLINRCAD